MISATHSWFTALGVISRARFGYSGREWRESVVTTKDLCRKQSRFLAHQAQNSLMVHLESASVQLRRDPTVPIAGELECDLLHRVAKLHLDRIAGRRRAPTIGDVFMLRRNQVHDGMIEIRRTKTGKPVLLPVPDDLQAALDLIPLPKGAKPHCEWYFYNGYRDVDNAIKRCWRTMNSVFQASGVKGAKTHRFRHTLATRMLEQGATYEDVAAVLGNSSRIVEKHYAKWSRDRQERINKLFRAAHGIGDRTAAVQ